MGKVVKGRNKPRRNETGVATMAELQAEESANEIMNDDTPRVPLLTKISSPDASHRVAAFQALSGLVVDDPETKRALSEPATIKLVLAHIADPVIDVQIAAVGTLRNMTQYGEPIVSSELVKNDIFTPLVAVIQKALTDANGNQDLVCQLLSQSVALLMNLCENSDKALELFSASKILPFFAQFLQPNKYPYDLVVTTGQFFFVITDNNARAVQELVAIDGYSAAVRALLQDPNVPLRIRSLLAAIETNIYANDMSALTAHTQLWQVLYQSLNNDYSVEVQKLFSRLATMEAEVVVRAIHSDDAILVDDLPTAAEREKKKISKMERSAAKKQQQQQQQQPTEAEDDTMMDEDSQETPPEDSEKEKFIKAETEKLQKELELLQENIKAQKLTIEILTNICSDEYVEEQETMDDVDDDEDEDGEYSQPSQDKTETQTPAGAAKSKLIWSSGLYPLVLHLAYPLPPFNTQNNRALENSEWAYNTAKYLREVQERAVSCLGNMLLDAGAKSNIKDPCKPWDCLVAVCAQNAQNTALLESATNGMWTLLRLFSSNGSTALIPNMSAVTGLTLLARAGGEPYASLRATALAILGIIATLPPFKSELLEFGRIFLEALPSQNAACIAEALNSIFDVFAETTHNNIVRSLDMISILRNYLPMLKLKVKNDKKLLSRDVWDRLDEAKLNLIRFLKYKRNQ